VPQKWLQRMLLMRQQRKTSESADSYCSRLSNAAFNKKIITILVQPSSQRRATPVIHRTCT
jgi:hypothetical protein